ncbi:MAG: hypothetical protein IJC32_00815 [Clostridia bacterium]|nr:hypothetical protein [Clostridia bacterium]
MASNKKKKNVGSFGILSLLFSAVLGIVATAAIAATLTIILGRLSYGTEDPMFYAPLIGRASLYFSVFLGGLFSNLQSRRHFGATIIHACAVMLILAAIRLIGGGSLGQNTVLTLLVIPCSLLGGALCYLKFPKKRKPKFKGRSK